jgi:hypothetical protein
MWETSIAENLNAADLGIVCLTPENLESPWILFESGALSKQVGRSSVCTYLLRLRPQDVPPPLGLFQHTAVEKEDTRRLIHKINQGCAERALPPASLNELFDATWHKMEMQLGSLPPSENLLPRSTDEMLAELLEIARKQVNRGNDAILNKLRYIEAAMMMLSYRTFGKAQMEKLAFTVLSNGQKFYPGDDNRLDSLWVELAKIVEKNQQPQPAESNEKESGAVLAAGTSEVTTGV